MVVYQPFKARQILDTFKAKIVLFLIYTLSVCFHLHCIWNNVTIQVPSCSIQKNTLVMEIYMTKIRPWQDFVLRTAAPFLILLICNLLIIIKLVHEDKRVKTMKATTNKEGELRGLAIMLLTVSFAHLMCVLPLQIMYFIDSTDPLGKPVTTPSQAKSTIKWAVAIDLYYINHSINFVLYCLSGRAFRKDYKKYVLERIYGTLCNKFCCKCGENNKIATIYVVKGSNTQAGNKLYKV